jgi:hypothetical protein
MSDQKPENRCLVCGSTETESGEHPTSVSGKYMHPSCRTKRMREAMRDFPNFEKWLQEYHPEIEPSERSKLAQEADISKEIEFLGRLPTDKAIRVMVAEAFEMSPKCVALIAEFGAYCDKDLRQKMIELYMSLGLSREEAEQELTTPRAVDPSLNQVH